MDPLLNLLDSYDLRSPSAVSRTLSRFSRARLRELLQDLSKFEPPSRTEKKGEISFFPGGGQMGLGCADRVSRGLLLVGDHIAFPNALKLNSGEWLGRLENGENLDQVRISLNTYLHPYIYQYIQLRPLLDAGLASLVDVTPPTFSLIHPLANRLRSEFLKWVEYGVDGAGKPWFVLGIGSNFYSSSSGVGIDSFGMTIVQAKPLISTDELIHMDGGFKPMGSGVERRDASPLLSGVHPLASSYEQFISVELFRVQALADGARRSGADLVTDSDADWEILDLLCSREDDSGLRVGDAALAETLADSLPFLANISLDKLVDLRLRLSTEFDALRGYLIDVSKGLAIAEPDPRKRSKRAREIILTEVQPRLSEYSAVMKATARDRLTSGVVGVGSIALTVMLAVLNRDWPTAAIATGALNASRPFLERAFEAQKQLDTAEGDPLFFLWRLKKDS